MRMKGPEKREGGENPEANWWEGMKKEMAVQILENRISGEDDGVKTGRLWLVKGERTCGSPELAGMERKGERSSKTFTSKRGRRFISERCKRLAGNFTSPIPLPGHVRLGNMHSDLHKYDPHTKPTCPELSSSGFLGNMDSLDKKRQEIPRRAEGFSARSSS